MCPLVKTVHVSKRSAVYYAEKASPQTNTPEQTQVNPRITPKKGPSFQQGTYEKENCIENLCVTPCDEITAQAFVVVATHDGNLQGVKHLSDSHLQSNENPQFGKPHIPVQNNDI